MSQEISAAEKNALIGDLLKTASGRQKLASAMTQPLRVRRDYASVGRKAFLVEQLPDGALPYYDKDPEVTAYVVNDEGQSVQNVTKGRRVSIPLFELACNPVISLTQIKERRFDIVERAQDQGRSQIQALEDERVFAVMNAVAQDGFDNIGAVNPEIPVVAPLTTAVLSDAFAMIERWDLRVQRIFINAQDYNDVRKWGRAELDDDSQQTLLRTGLMASIWGAQFIQTRLVERGTIYVCAEPEFFGRIPVRTELSVISADEPALRRIGFSIFEQLGIGCHNPLGLVKISLIR